MATYMTEARQAELLGQLRDEIAAILERMFGLVEEGIPQWEPKVSQEGMVDPMLMIGDTGIGVYAYLNADKPEPVESFCIGHMVYYPGVRYYPDGSGEPPSEDFKEVAETDVKQIRKTAEEFLKVVFNLCLNQALESRAEDDMAAEQEKYEQEKYGNN